MEQIEETPEQEPKAEYRIPEGNLARLRFDVERLNKRARRLALPPIVVTVLRTEVKIIETEGVREEFRYAITKIEGTTPVLAGWHFIAALKHVEGEVLIKVAEGATLPAPYLKASPDDCDHCHKIRRRLAAFVVQHEDGRTALVGRNCLADFIRTTSPETLAAQAEFLTSLDFGGYAEDEDGGDRPSGHGYYRVNAEDFMALALRMIAAEGFVSKAKANPPKTPSTVQRISEQIGGSTRIAVTEDERAKARDVIEWAKAWGEEADPSTEDYRYNVGVVAGMEYIEQRTWGIFASIPSAKGRAEEKAHAIEKTKAEHPTEWIGEIGKRQFMTLKLVREPKVIPSDFGDSLLYTFEDEKGNVVKWFSSSGLRVPDGRTRIERVPVWDKKANVQKYDCEHKGDEAHNLFPWNDSTKPECKWLFEDRVVPFERGVQIGDTVKIKATVKAHEEWNGLKQTLVTRGALVALLTTGDDTATVGETEGEAK